MEAEESRMFIHFTLEKASQKLTGFSSHTATKAAILAEAWFD